MKILIGLCGRAGSGKTTIAKYLEEKYCFRRAAFADPLKRMLIQAGMCTYEEAYVEKTTQSRWLMQKIGTEIFMQQVDPDYWTRLMDVKIHENMEACGIVVEDVRFPEEAECLLRYYNAILIRVERIDHLDEDAGTTHESESHVDSLPANYIIPAKSGDVGKLISSIDKILHHKGIGAAATS